MLLCEYMIILSVCVCVRPKLYCVNLCGIVKVH